MSGRLRIAEDFTLPLEAVTQTFAILAIRRAGKSNAAAVMAEEMFAAKLPFVVIDPKGDWYGLRAPGEGSPGLPVPIFGGLHGDVPLERGSGAYIADLVAEERLSCVLDVSEFSEHDKIKFLLDFAERLLRVNRDALMLYLEEADDYLPQKPFKEQVRLVGAFQKLVRRGGFRGIGVTLISQRSAVVHKDVLTQTENLIVLRTTSPQDRKAIEDWIEHAGQSKAILRTLPSLQDGEAWFYSPNFLQLPEPVRIRFRRRATFDSGSTPGARGKRREPATLADIDLGAIRSRMAETIERAKADDPRELKKRIAELERQAREAKKAVAPAPPPATKAERVEVLVLKDAQAKRLEKAADRFGSVGASLLEVSREITAALARVANQPAPRAVPVPRPVAPMVPRKAPEPRRSPRAVAATNGSITRPQQRILDTLATLQEMGVAQPSKSQLALWCEVSPTSGGYFNNLGALRAAGFVEYPQPSAVALTAEGAAVAAPGEALAVEEMQAAICAKVGAPKAAILRALIDIYPDAIAKDELAERVGVSPTSGGYFNNLGALRTLGLIDYPAPGQAAALPVLFLED